MVLNQILPVGSPVHRTSGPVDRIPLSIESEEVRTQTLLKRRRARDSVSNSFPLPSKCFG